MQQLRTALFGIRLGHTRDILQSFAAESFRDLGQGGSLCIRKPEPGRQVGSEDAILSRQVFVAQQQFLIDEAGHKGQQACPLKSIAPDRTFIIDELQPATRASILAERARRRESSTMDKSAVWHVQPGVNGS